MRSLCWQPYKKYENHAKEREHERKQYRREQRRRGRSHRFVFPRELQRVRVFTEWVSEEVRHDQHKGVVINQMVVDTSIGPLRIAAAYKSMFAYGNHFGVISSEKTLRTCNSGIAATFR